jgi:hypothetical protein
MARKRERDDGEKIVQPNMNTMKALCIQLKIPVALDKLKEEEYLAQTLIGNTV